MIKSTLSTVDLFRGIGITTGLSRWFVGGSPDFALKSEEARVQRYPFFTNFEE